MKSEPSLDRKIVVISPLRRGIPAPRNFGEQRLWRMAVTGIDPTTQIPLSPKEYLQEVVPNISTGLSQMIRRALGSDTLARCLWYFDNKDPRRYALSGVACKTADGATASESSVAAMVSGALTPRSITNDLHPVQVEQGSHCTVSEISRMMAIGHELGAERVIGVTDEHRERRADTIARDLTGRISNMPPVDLCTPEGVMHFVKTRQGALTHDQHFVQDVMQATGPTFWRRFLDGLHEGYVLRPIHRVSEWTGGKLEPWLAGQMRTMVHETNGKHTNGDSTDIQ